MKRYLSSIIAVLALSLATVSLEMNAQVRRSGSGESRSSSSVSTKSSSASRSASSATRSTSSASRPSSSASRSSYSQPASRNDAPARQPSAVHGSNRTSSSVSRNAMPSGNLNITGRTTSGRSAGQPSASRSVSRPVSRPSSPARTAAPGGVPVHRNPGVARRPAPVSTPYRAGTPVPVHRVRPVERGFLPYTYRPVFHGDPGCHYYGYRVRRLPVGYTVYRYNNVVYYYYDGIYYRPYGEYYTVCRPPFGVCVAATATGLALASVTFAIGSAIANAITNASNAAIVNNGNGTVSPANLPQQNLGQSLGLSQSYRGDNPYYYQDGVFYELINGQYYVIVPPL